MLNRTPQCKTMTTTTRDVSRTASPPSLTNVSAVILAAVVALGTIYSVVYDTALDTSNPLSHRAVRPDGQTSYFAQKSNVINVYFVKYAWGWTSVAFFGLLSTSPSSIKRPTRRVGRWVVTTLVWAIFATWFFGPSLFDRINFLSGARCLVRLPDINPGLSLADPPGRFVTVPIEYCQSRIPLTPNSHPTFFAEYPDLIKALTGAAAIAGGSPVLETLKLKPRLYRGHDVSGHLFLLTLSVLFLADQLTPSLKLLYPSIFSPSRTPPDRSVKEETLPLHIYAVGFGVALTAIWVLMCLTTSVYFHTVGEKVTGFGKFSDSCPSVRLC